MTARSDLNTLEMAGLIGLAQTQPELAYAFRHALVQAAAYGSLVRRSRQALHRAAGETLEALYPAGPARGPLLGELAHHFFEAEAWDKALDYAWQAGQAAQGRHAAAEAAAYYSRGLEAAGRLGRAAPTALHRARGQAYETVGDFERARADHEQALSDARAAADPRREWQSLLDLGFLWSSQDYARTGAYFDRALALARALDDPAALARSLNRVGNWHVNVERPADALHFHRQALALFEQLDDGPGLAATLDLLALAELERGALASAAGHYAAAIERFRSLGDPRGLCSTLGTYASALDVSYIHDTLPVVTSQAEPAREALAVARAIGWRAGEAFSLMQLALTLGPLGEFDQALTAGREAEAIAREIGHQQWLGGARLALGALHLDLLDPAPALDQLHAASPLTRQVGSLIFQRHLAAALALAQIALAERAPGAEHDARLESAAQALNEAQQAGAPDTLAARQVAAAQVELLLAQARPAAALAQLEPLGRGPEGEHPLGAVPRLDWLRGRALLALGQPEAAERTLAAAEAGARRLGLLAQLWRIVVDRASAMRALGLVGEAAQARVSAQRAVEELAGRMEAGKAKATLLNEAAQWLRT